MRFPGWTTTRGRGSASSAGSEPSSPGEVLFAEGDQGSDFFIVESGSVTIVQGYGKENRIIAIQGAHRFLGELSMLTGQRLYLSGVMRERGEVIQVPIEKLRELVDEDKTLSDLFLGAFIRPALDPGSASAPGSS